LVPDPAGQLNADHRGRRSDAQRQGSKRGQDEHRRNHRRFPGQMGKSSRIPAVIAFRSRASLLWCMARFREKPRVHRLYRQTEPPHARCVFFLLRGQYRDILKGGLTRFGRGRSRPLGIDLWRCWLGGRPPINRSPWAGLAKCYVATGAQSNGQADPGHGAGNRNRGLTLLFKGRGRPRNRSREQAQGARPVTEAWSAED